MNIIGMKIKRLRKELNLTQKDLSCEILDRTYISKIENGHVLPSLLQLNHISKCLNVPSSFLLNDGNFIDTSFSNTLCELNKLFNKKQYFSIIEHTKNVNFTTNYYLGMSYYHLDLKKQAIVYLEESEKYFNKLNHSEQYDNVELLCLSLNILRKLQQNGEYSESNLKMLTKINSYLESFQKTSTEIYFGINNNISVHYLMTNNYISAINFLEDFLQQKCNIASVKLLAYMHSNLNIAYFSVKNYEQAINHIKKAISFYSYTNDTLNELECYINYFNCLVYKDDLTAARDLFNSLNVPSLNPELFHTFKILELILLLYEKDINSIIVKSKNIKFNLLRSKSKVDFNFIMGNAYFLLNEINKSEKHYLKCIKSLEVQKRFLDLSVAYNHLFKITNDEKYNLLCIKNKILYNDQKFNPININITRPYDFI